MAVYSFGFNKMGALGLGNNEDSLEPNIIEGLKGKKIEKVFCGEQHSVAITEHGDLYVWGRGREGQLGNGQRKDSTIPTQVKALGHMKIIQADSGATHIVALSETGKVFIWGRLYRLATEDKAWFSSAVEMVGMKTDKTQAIIDKSVAQYLSGQRAPLSEEEMMESLNNNFGNFIPHNQTTPILMAGPLSKIKVSQVAAGYAYSIAVSQEGKVYGWGFNEKGQLGLGNRFNKEEPSQMLHLQDVRIVKASCGQQHTALLSDDGSLYTCGLGVFGQLGHGEPRDSLIPRRIEKFYVDEIIITDVTLGSFYSTALTSTGQIYSWGHGEYGQHGGSENFQDWSTGGNAEEKDKSYYHSVPRLLQGMNKSAVINSIACGHLHTLAVTDKNEVFSWGWGASGCLGHGNRRFQLIPKEVSQLQGEIITSVAAGHKHSLIVTSSSVSTFAFDFANLVGNAAYSDIVFKVDKKELVAHKSVVFARCLALKSMYLMQTRFLHKEIDELEIKGVKMPIFMGIIRYLYTDHVKIAPHLRRELSLLATKWGLHRLAALCKRGTTTTNVHENSRITQIPSSTFSLEMATIVNNSQSNPDITFQVQGTTIVAHRAILKPRCKYFELLFESQFKERHETNFVIDETITPEIFLVLLGYLYTNNEELITEDNAIELLRAADRFMVDDLKQMIEDYVERSIETDNVAFLLEVADKYGVPRLKRACIEFICEGFDSLEQVKQTQAYEDMCESASHLVKEVDEFFSLEHSTELESVPTWNSKVELPQGRGISSPIKSSTLQGVRKALKH
eukprot:TRINITY_DN378_c0_g1_i1.p1 TRINITY_DN378_c0_g1~~TRINITY_DN378_c0_g1_i1.p1  ORF type:complete len:790 (-),score=282.46 TRINITY_DN378_c0_g1_i1:27-2396(-)